MTSVAAPPLAAVLPYLVALLALAAIALMFLGIRYARVAKANGSHGGALLEPVAAAPGPSRTLPQSMRLASWQLRRLVAGGSGGGIYDVPWVVAVGAGAADLDRLLPDRLPWPPDLSTAHQTILGEVGRVSFCRAGAVIGSDDGLLDDAQWRTRWHALIRALETCRPERPIDGLVVVLRAAELLGQPDGQVARGDQLYHLVWSLQRVTGWRVPVYVLIRGCDELTGFADWVLALPRDARRQILGWSVPYAIDSVFEPRWVDDGVAEMVRQLSAAQLLLMMPEPDLAVAEGLLLFPGEAQRLAAPLSVVLTGMLRPSAYHEAFMFRGFFLAGSVPGAEATGAREEAFAEALFTQKIFPEHRLAQPAYGETTRRHRQIRMAQIALAAIAVLCVFGILYLQRVESEYLPPVATLLREIDQEVATRAARNSPQLRGPAGRERLQDVALQLLNSMAAIQLNRIDTIAAPTSLATSANSRAEKAIATGYNIAVLRAVYDALTDRFGLGPILAPSAPPGAPAATPNAALATTVENIVVYDKYLRVYQGITAQPSIGDVSALMSYALNVQLPPGFTTNYGLYQLALSHARLEPIQTTQVQPVVERILQDRYQAVLDDTFQSDPLVTAIKRLASLGSELAASQPSSSPDAGRALLAETRTTLETITGLVAPPNYAWLSGPPNAVVASPLLDKLKGVRVVRPDFIAGLRTRALQASTYMRDWLLGSTAFAQVPVLASANEGAALSPAMLATRRLLNDLFAQRFMQPAPASPGGPPPATATPIDWDMRSLRQAQGIAENFLAFVPREDKTLPPSVEAGVQFVAGAETAANIAAFLRLAARPAGPLPNGGSGALLQDVTGLRTALPILVNLRNTLRQAGATAEAASLDALVAQQCATFLRRLYGDLVAAAPYRLADPGISFWQGSPPLAAPAFGASSAADLASTLPTRRDFVETLGRDYAEPLVGYLRDPGTARSGLAAGPVAQWRSILDTFNRYHRSDPTNSLTRLELFITVDMDKIDLANCRQMTTAGGAGDYFAEQLAAIKGAIAGRCARLIHTNTSDRYASLSATFNAELAGRFPFAPLTPAPVAANGLALGAADPQSVRSFFLDYGPDLPALQARFQSARDGTGRAIEAFLNRLSAVRAAFMPMLADPSGKTPLSYQVNISFFTNPKAARAQNQVLDATLGIGNLTASSLNGPSQIVWTNGQPLDVRLRWAANAPLAPDASRRQLMPSVSGLDANFDYGGNWALLRLLEAQAPTAADFNALQDRQPEVVEFVVPLTFNRNAAPGGNAKVDAARVYMRLALTGIVQAPGQPPQTMPIALPPFPTAAPLLGRAVSYLGPPAEAGPIQLTLPSLAGATP